MSIKSILHCAIYTRKSSEEGLEQEFDSLHSQREACTAYISSQKHEGWQVIKDHYDDGGFSGGNMERPALKQLLEDIGIGKVNAVVVYKVDRLTRSLTDFAKIIEQFDKNNVSFVSVTQQFNTTSSMGRLTLNVLLSFAQFEREITGERIRDKIAASKKKGIWMGGFVPLGYDVKDRKLLVNSEEAKTVQYIYRRYLELGCVRLLKDDLDEKGIRSKARKNKSRCSFSRGLLYKILSNQIYTGQICHKGNCYPGQHQAIIDRESWEKVQSQLASNAVEHKASLSNPISFPLANKLFDTSGERLVSSYANKKGRRYYYYISESLRANPKVASPSGWRLPAKEIEEVIKRGLLGILHDDVAITTAMKESGITAQHVPSILNAAKKIQVDSADLLKRFLDRVELRQDGIALTISLSLVSLVPSEVDPKVLTIVRDIPMQMKRRGHEMRLVIDHSEPARVDQTLLKASARAYKWFNDLISGRIKNMNQIALQEGLDRSYVFRVISLAFLAPDIIESIIAGRQPVDLTVEKLTRQIDLPLSWMQQRQFLDVG